MSLTCRSRPVLRAFIVLAFAGSISIATDGQSFLGFDRNQYPGDQHLSDLRKDFAYTGYWLNNPPGSSANTWAGKRGQLEAAGFGFLVLFNGRAYAQLGNVERAARLGTSDAALALQAARAEGFPAHTIIFLDQEEGGRLLPEQKAYLFAWIDGILQAGYGAGVYCSGIAAKESGGASVVTATDIREHAAGRNIVYWVTNDSCPPSPGCTSPTHSLGPQDSRVEFADIWQFAQSPKRRDFANGCRGYSPDGNCYLHTSAPAKIHLDLNVATSADPSHGRTH